MNHVAGYIYLILAIILGILSNSFLKVTNNFTNIYPTIFCIITIISCIFCLSKTMSVIPVGFAYASYGGLTISAVTIFGIFKYNQIPNTYGIIGIILIIVGVILLNTMGKLINYNEKNRNHIFIFCNSVVS